MNREEIIEKLKITDLDVAEQDEILLRLENNIADNVKLEVLDRLSETDKVALDAILSDEERHKFLAESIDNLPEFIAQVSKNTIDEFLSLRNS